MEPGLRGGSTNALRPPETGGEEREGPPAGLNAAVPGRGAGGWKRNGADEKVEARGREPYPMRVPLGVTAGRGYLTRRWARAIPDAGPVRGSRGEGRGDHWCTDTLLPQTMRPAASHTQQMRVWQASTWQVIAWGVSSLRQCTHCRQKQPCGHIVGAASAWASVSMQGRSRRIAAIVKREREWRGSERVRE